MMRPFNRFNTRYGNDTEARCQTPGHSHRSKLEAAVCGILYLREKAGEIRLLQIESHQHVCGPQGHKCPPKGVIQYVADFKCLDLSTQEEFFVEAKGYANDTWPLKKRLWRHYGPAPLEIWMGNHRNPRLTETLPRGEFA